MQQTRRVLLRIVVLCVFAGEALSQSAYLPEGSGGALFGASGTFNRNGRALAGVLGFSVNGRFDARLGVTAVSLPDAHASGVMISPAFEFFASKPERGVALPGLSIGLGLETGTLTSDFAPGSGGTSITTINLSSTAFGDLSLGTGARLMPAIGLTYQRDLTNTREIYSFYTYGPGPQSVTRVVTTETTKGRLIWQGGASLVIPTEGTDAIVITAALALTERLTSYGIGLALLY